MSTEKTDRNFEDFTHRGGGVDIMQKVDELDDFLNHNSLDYLGGLGLQVKGPAADRVAVLEADGTERDVIMLGSNSYLGLTTHPRVIAACKKATDEYGYGMGAVPLYAGTSPLHRELEERLAAFYGTEDAIIFPCGYSGNVGVIAALCGPGDMVINDTANHASIFDGCALSGADIKIYLHRNMRHLEKVLKALPDSQRGRLIITDGVFSMHGDLAPLDQIVELAQRYHCRIMIDEAHAVGVIGPTGRGTAEHFGCSGKIDLTCGTLSKTPGAIGGYCAGSAALVRYLRYYARTYFFSTALPAPVAAGLIEVFKLMEADQAGRDRLWKNVDYMLNGLRSLGFDTGETQSAIIPVIVGDEMKLGAFQNELRQRGVFTNVVTYPAVRRKECRLRVSIMNTLTQSEMDRALTLFAELGRKYSVIK
ncbi:MAG: aminotransferase class I/II-fold pyridoxal phosphate-dependent enzyme [Lentisphaerae bacterium]|jgi:glycine C-acetyltransferase|nr:aminotransferase class I/II-fold pyridoxal phosphate-dependent enzyme [Lentisphaerota bacterium]